MWELYKLEGERYILTQQRTQSVLATEIAKVVTCLYRLRFYSKVKYYESEQFPGF